MAIWPGSLPSAFLVDTEDGQDRQNRDEFDTDYGPSLYGRRYTGRVADHSGVMAMNKTQKDALKTFFRTTLKDGSLEFTMNNAITDNTSKTCRMSAPQIHRVNNVFFRVAVAFEILN